jgi:hypothetical protein
MMCIRLNSTDNYIVASTGLILVLNNPNVHKTSTSTFRGSVRAYELSMWLVVQRAFDAWRTERCQCSSPIKVPPVPALSAYVCIFVKRAAPSMRRPRRHAQQGALDDVEPNGCKRYRWRTAESLSHRTTPANL